MSNPANIYVAIIDDDESLCRSMSRLLRAAGFHPIPFLSAEDFLVDPICDHFSCLLVDIQLGGMSGIELQQKLASEGGQAPIIFITAYDDPDARAQALTTGCAGFFRKTDPGAEIISAVRSAVQRH